MNANRLLADDSTVCTAGGAAAFTTDDEAVFIAAGAADGAGRCATASATDRTIAWIAVGVTAGAAPAPAPAGLAKEGFAHPARAQLLMPVIETGCPFTSTAPPHEMDELPPFNVSLCAGVPPLLVDVELLAPGKKRDTVGCPAVRSLSGPPLMVTLAFPGEAELDELDESAL